MDARHLISTILVGELDRLGRNEITYEKFCDAVNLLERYKFVEEHNSFFPAVKELGEKVHQQSKVWDT